MRPTILLPLIVLALASSCAGPARAVRPPPGHVERRQQQIRVFENQTEEHMLSAGLGVLQDLGFNLDHGESRLGVISASRKLTSRRDLNSAEIARGVLWAALVPSIMGPAMLLGAAEGVKEPQLVRVSLVTSPAKDSGTAACTVRITAQRLVFKDPEMKKLEKLEPLDDPSFYQEFFKRLNESVRLDEQRT
jgi:hypothetical protein